MELKYRIINSTVKPIKKDDRGNDLRKHIDRVGHPIKFKDKTNDVILHAGQVRLVSELNTGMMSLKRGGYIAIEEVADMSAALKDHVYKPEEAAKVALSDKVKATEMGHDSITQKSGTEYEGAINPDGNPNFIVQAKRKNKNATATSGSSKDGEGAEVSPNIP